MHRAHIGLGSNQGDPKAQVERGIRELDGIGTVIQRSSLYATKPWGNPNQPDFVNAVVALDTDLEPGELLATLKEAERRLGRQTAERWGPRLIDFDILTYDEERVQEELLTIPHPHLERRAFVLVPLAEIDARFAPLRDALSADDLATVVKL